jgi:hypothetical protein
MAALLAYQQQQQQPQQGGKEKRVIVVFDLGHAHLDVAVVEEDEQVRGCVDVIYIHTYIYMYVHIYIYIYMLRSARPPPRSHNITTTKNTHNQKYHIHIT